MRRALETGYVLDDDRSRVDVDAVFRFLDEEAYWVRGRSRATIDRLVRESTKVIAATRRTAHSSGSLVSCRMALTWPGAAMCSSSQSIAVAAWEPSWSAKQCRTPTIETATGTSTRATPTICTRNLDSNPPIQTERWCGGDRTEEGR